MLKLLKRLFLWKRKYDFKKMPSDSLYWLIIDTEDLGVLIAAKEEYEWRDISDSHFTKETPNYDRTFRVSLHTAPDPSQQHQD